MSAANKLLNYIDVDALDDQRKNILDHVLNTLCNTNKKSVAANNRFDFEKLLLKMKYFDISQILRHPTGIEKLIELEVGLSATIILMVTGVPILFHILEKTKGDRAIELLQYFYKRGEKIDEKLSIDYLEYKKGASLLHIAALKENVKVVEYLLSKNKIAKNIQDDDDNTPLHYVCSTEDYINSKIITLLINGDPSIMNIQNKKKETPLIIALQNEYSQIANELLRNSTIDILKIAHQQAADIGNTKAQKEIDKTLEEKHKKAQKEREKGNIKKVYIAIQEKNLEEMERLILEKQIDINSCYENVPLLYHSLDWLEGTKKLITLGLDINKASRMENIPIIFFAIYKSDSLSMLEYWINKGEDIFYVSPIGVTALYVAAYNNRPNIIRYLLEKGVKVNIINSAGNTVLHNICDSSSVVDPEIIKLLVDSDPSIINIQNHEGNTALMIALRHQQIQAANKLLEYEQTDVNTLNKGSLYSPNLGLHSALRYAALGKFNDIQYCFRLRTDKKLDIKTLLSKIDDSFFQDIQKIDTCMKIAQQCDEREIAQAIKDEIAKREYVKPDNIVEISNVIQKEGCTRSYL